MELLLLAGSSIAVVKKYVNSGQCFIVEFDNAIVKKYVLFKKSRKIVELINVAVSPIYQGHGIEKN